jgi:hypothetical protein
MTVTDDTLIRDLPLSARVKHALYRGRSPAFPYFNSDRTFGEARTLSDEVLLATDNFGHTSLEEWVTFRDRALGLTPSYIRISRRARLHSLLLAHESAAIALYDIQRADADPDDFADIDRAASITKRQEALAKARETILNQLIVEHKTND